VNSLNAQEARQLADVNGHKLAENQFKEACDGLNSEIRNRASNGLTDARVLFPLSGIWVKYRVYNRVKTHFENKGFAVEVAESSNNYTIACYWSKEK